MLPVRKRVGNAELQPVGIWLYNVSPVQGLFDYKNALLHIGEGASLGQKRPHESQLGKRIMGWTSVPSHLLGWVPLCRTQLAQFVSSLPCYCFVLWNQTFKWFSEKTEHWETRNMAEVWMSVCIMSGSGQASRPVGWVTLHHCITVATGIPVKACLEQK